MRTSQWFAPALCALVAQGCGVPDECVRGERGCSCTLQATCDPGLSCQANVCIFHVDPSGSQSTAAPAQPQVGAECTTDVECGMGLRCITAASRELGAGGGAPGGYCTASCASTEECRAIDAQSSCELTSLRLCLRDCRGGNAGLGENKCLNRATLGCSAPFPTTPDDRQPGLCFPQCASDADCPGRSCNLRSGYCADQPSTGKAIGQICVSGVECAGGRCERGVCSALCVGGRLDRGCGFPAPGVATQAACLLPVGDNDGDLARCIELCDQTADCADPAAECETTQPIAGRAGFCERP